MTALDREAAEPSAQAWSEWPAPAKLNLFLHITGRRADGYHLLQTVFQLLDWGDRVRLRLRADGHITRLHALPDIAESSDLSVRAAQLLRATAGIHAGVEIDLHKHIPQGAGLGGGSSDAATVLVALNQLWACGLDVDSLAALGLQLGADVPVFVRGLSAFGEGVGEKLTPLTLPERYFVLVDPGVRVATAELFQAEQLTRDAAPVTISGFLSAPSLQNVFEPVVRARYPAVQEALDWLARFGSPRLSGSGGAVFLPVVDAAAGEAIIAQCPPGMRAWPVRGVNRSPLLDRLQLWLAEGV